MKYSKDIQLDALSDAYDEATMTIESLFSHIENAIYLIDRDGNGVNAKAVLTEALTIKDDYED